jgi:hypothetical protein
MEDLLVSIANITSVNEADVRASIQRVINHAESIWDEWAWQVENQTWALLGYANWDEMRRGEYGSLTSVTAPRAERPELVQRFRKAGLTQRETAETLGVSRETVKRNDEPTYRPRDPKGADAPFGHDVVEAELVEDEPSFVSATAALAGPEDEVGEVIEDDETVDLETGEIRPRLSVVSPAPARPIHQAPVANKDEWSEQDRAEELAGNLARNLSLLYAITNPDRRADYIATWRLGTQSRPVLGQNFITPEHMRRLADALNDFAKEWETADV